MNHIEVKKIPTQYGYEERYWVIDGKSLPEYLDMWADESEDSFLKSIQPFLGLYPAWGKQLNWEGDIRFVWKLIDMDSVILPLLVCEDDLDFDCIVIVADVEKTKDCVYWKRIGYVLHDNEDFEEEKKNGILNLSAYSDDDWEKYGDNIALEHVHSPEWQEWISKNWEEINSFIVHDMSFDSASLQWNILEDTLRTDKISDTSLTVLKNLKYDLYEFFYFHKVAEEREEHLRRMEICIRRKYKGLPDSTLQILMTDYTKFSGEMIKC